MGFLDGLKQFLAIEPMQVRTVDPFVDAPTFEAQLRAVQSAARPWRIASIDEAMGVPAIQRAVTLITNATASLSVEAYRDGELLPETPALVARPDPFSTPEQAYGDMAYAMATRGESVLWIAARDANDAALSLVSVPLHELTVEENTRNRLFPIYTWGDRKSTRYSAANKSGEFVHIFYMRRNRFALRGVGPLQMAGAAVSVSVEAQEFAANFYAEGGKPSVNLHSEIELEDNEAKALREQWVTTPSNMPQVTSGPLELREVKLNEQGGQMLMARDYQNGDSARLYGIPGALMEYGVAGSSLTYQNLADVWINFVRGSLSINYLEKIEQALTDLLPRRVTSRFAVSGLQRADEQTRWNIYKVAAEVIGPEEAADMARKREGLTAGNIENAPVPASPPAAVPASLPQMRSTGPVRCEGMRLLRGRLTTCNKLLAEAGPFIGTCPRCARVYEADVTPAVSPETLALRAIAESMARSVAERAPEPTVVYHVSSAPVPEPVDEPPEPGTVHIPPPVVRVEAPVVNLPAPVVTIDTAPFAAAIDKLRIAFSPKPVHRTVERDEDGRIVTIRETTEEIA